MNAPIVSEPRSFQQLCARVRDAARVAIDTEFHAERTYAPRLMVVQLAFDDGAAIVDALALSDLHPLAAALTHTTVIGHALSADLKIFADRFGIVPARVFDTQILAAFLGYGMQVSLADLVRSVCGVRLAKSQTVSDWSARPFSARQVEYLVDDVVHLLPLYDALQPRLVEKGRYEWAYEECEELGDIEHYRLDERRAYLRIPGATRMNRRELGILSELVRMRDRIARERDLPVRYVLPDDVVGGLAVIKPTRLEDLSQLRRLDGNTKRQLGQAILGAVARAQALAEDELPLRPARPPAPAREPLVNFLNAAIAEIAREAELPPSLLVPRAALERLSREIPVERAEFERVLALQPWRLGLVAQPLWSLCRGEASLRIEGYSDGDPKVRVAHDPVAQ
ncbi:MAG: ribonuclease D [Candidatus Eremiobacteraeota bacterium]|nr:ribonuclease D [Candidatus Eremiobacteraeota bacterium]MBV9055489.1 ribonuclease D [Candidatus Eremiobacteraeota bacterium]MBV9699067.1 ribonuclease D [Candidatus Eremiobacteraeota bacterium]